VKRRDFALRTLPALTAFGLVACSQPSAEAAGNGNGGLTSKAVYDLAATGNGFTTGPVMAANTMYVFFDTTCPHCAQLWASAKPLQGKLKIVWMPVAYLRPQSLTQGAAILSAANPAAAMEENETLLLARKGGISVSGDLPEAALAKVKANTEILRKLQAESVPLIVFRNGKSGVFGKTEGALETGQLAEMTGV
jgi:thiol:disulfide interchange protein DsbG